MGGAQSEQAVGVRASYPERERVSEPRKAEFEAECHARLTQRACVYVRAARCQRARQQIGGGVGVVAISRVSQVRVGNASSAAFTVVYNVPEARLKKLPNLVSGAMGAKLGIRAILCTAAQSIFHPVHQRSTQGAVLSGPRKKWSSAIVPPGGKSVESCQIW